MANEYRVSTEALEALVSPVAPARATAQGLEALVQVEQRVRATAQALEVLMPLPPTQGRATALALEVLIPQASVVAARRRGFMNF